MKKEVQMSKEPGLELQMRTDKRSRDRRAMLELWEALEVWKRQIQILTYSQIKSFLLPHQEPKPPSR